MKRWMDIDICQIVSRFENIDRMLQMLESRFKYDSDVTTVAQRISDMDSEENIKRLVHSEKSSARPMLLYSTNNWHQF